MSRRFLGTMEKMKYADKSRKIVVVGVGMGGENVADFLERELPFVEVERDIDWSSDRYMARSESERKKKILSRVEKYLGVVDLIIFSECESRAILSYFWHKYPKQRFIGLNELLGCKQNFDIKRALVMLNKAGGIVEQRRNVREVWPEARMYTFDTSMYRQIIDDGALTKEILRANLSWDYYLDFPKINWRKTERKMNLVVYKDISRAVKQTIIQIEKAKKLYYDGWVSKYQKEQRLQELEILTKVHAKTQKSTLRKMDTIILMCPHFWGYEQDLWEIFGGRVRVIDFRSILLVNIRRALKIRGGGVVR